MGLISIYIINAETKKFICVKNLEFVSYFSRDSVAELMNTFVCHIANRIDTDERKILEHRDFMFTCLKREAYTVVCITDPGYPVRVLFQLIDHCHSEPTQSNAQRILDTCQDARVIDPIYHINCSLDETMVIMHQTIDKILERGEKLDDLVERSAQLSASSKMFYKTARQHNRCCTVS